MLTAFLGRIIIIIFGVLHPSYKTYKAIKRKDYQEVVILGMYWVVFSIFTTVELVTDIFLQWLPFYYEAKIAFVIWLVTPATSGYSIIYRKLIHPELSKRETEIDDAIQKAAEHGYTKVVEFGAKGLNYAAKTVLTTALMGQDFLADQLRRRSTSMIELGRPAPQEPFLSNQRHQFGAGDNRDQSIVSMSSSTPHPPSQSHQLLQDDPFALNWLNPGPTGSLGRKWRPPLRQGLYGVPEDPEGSHDSSLSDSVSISRTTVSKRPTGVTQAYLKMVTKLRPVRAYSLSSSADLPGSPFAKRPTPTFSSSHKQPAPMPPTTATRAHDQ